MRCLVLWKLELTRVSPVPDSNMEILGKKIHQKLEKNPTKTT